MAEHSALSSQPGTAAWRSTLLQAVFRAASSMRPKHRHTLSVYRISTVLHAEAQRIIPVVVPPLADAVCLIHSHQLHIAGALGVQRLQLLPEPAASTPVTAASMQQAGLPAG